MGRPEVDLKILRTWARCRELAKAHAQGSIPKGYEGYGRDWWRQVHRIALLNQEIGSELDALNASFGRCRTVAYGSNILEKRRRLATVREQLQPGRDAARQARRRGPLPAGAAAAPGKAPPSAADLAELLRLLGSIGAVARHLHVDRKRVQRWTVRFGLSSPFAPPTAGPSREELSRLLGDLGSISAIARHLEVDRKRVKHWMRRLLLESPSPGVGPPPPASSDGVQESPPSPGPGVVDALPLPARFRRVGSR